MVCKINFDYEVLLSDDNDSISSPHFSSDEESFGKKFVLGDNIRNVNPLEVFSVRQLNDVTPTNFSEPVSDLRRSVDDIVFPKIPMNNHLHYDEAISNFDEESVTESEGDLYSGSSLSQDKDLYSSSNPLKYNLPTVNRFQMVLASDPPKTISSVTKYCLNEKHKRLQTETVNKSNTKSGQQITEAKRPHIGGHDKCLQWKTPGNNRIDDSIITPELLSRLPVDLLAAFIDGEKPLHEIVNQMNNNHKEQHTQCKKPKRQKSNKKPNKHSKLSSLSDIPLQNKNSSESSGKGKRRNQRKNNAIDNKLDGKTLEDDVIIRETTSPGENSNLAQISPTTILPNPNQDEILHHSPRNSSNIPIVVDSILTDNVADSENIESHGPTDSSEDIPNSQSHLELTIADNNDDDENNKVSSGSDLLYGDGPYEDQSCSNVHVDACSDNRTSSTDSGFHETDSFDSNDESHSIVNKDSVRIDAIQNREESLSKIELTEEMERKTMSRMDCKNDDPQYRQVDEFIDLSSFKYKFINDSDVMISSTGSSTIVDECQELENSGGTLAEQPVIADSETTLESCNALPDVSDGSRGLQGPMEIENPLITINTSNKLANVDDYDNVNYPNAESIDKSTNVYNEPSESCRITDSDHVVFHKPNNPKRTSTEGVMCGANYDPFQMNYYSPESSIDNREDISKFLNYQWLKFCEKYTMSSHILMML